MASKYREVYETLLQEMRSGKYVWQDFMTGCGVFPQGDDYARATREEVLSIVIRHRNHPSLVLWSGNNENDSAFHWFVGNKLARDPNKNRNVSVTPGAMRHSMRNNLMANQTKIMFRSVARDLETFVEQSQLVQAEAMKTFCEMFRSRAFDAAMAAA